MKRSFSGLLEVVTCVSGTSTGWLMPWWRIGTVVWPEHGHVMPSQRCSTVISDAFQEQERLQGWKYDLVPCHKKQVSSGWDSRSICKRHFARFCDHAIRNLVQCSLACPLPRLITGIHSSARFCKPPSNPTSWPFDPCAVLFFHHFQSIHKLSILMSI